MCGILGILSSDDPALGSESTPVPWLSDAQAIAACDTLTHRGPDDAGLDRVRCRTGAGAVLAHRRLAVVDPSAMGHQPMCLERADGTRRWLVYNGELYNDAELRARLRDAGHRFRSDCDAETLLVAIEHWGTGALPRLRGMYAFATVDTRGGNTLLARDPLGIKPLYVWHGAPGGASGGRDRLVFASEPPALLGVPGVPCEPDWVTASAYLTTIRTTLGSRTLFRGIETLEPGECREYRATRGSIELTGRATLPITSESGIGSGSEDEAIARVRDGVGDSVRAHLRADVPMCSLLSGGLDSAIIASEAVGAVGALSTYCSGSREVAEVDGVPQSEDFAFAATVSDALGTTHREVPVTGAQFADRWRWMVRRLGVPLSTPNEVAIHKVAQALRADGHIVALSGEGADELFGGYAGPMLQAAAHARGVLRGTLAGRDADAGIAELHASAWAPTSTLGALLRPEILDQARDDPGTDPGAGQPGALLEAWYSGRFRAELDALGTEADPFERRLEAHLRFQRRVNLAGLLGRLDTATMLASVEGRTPFADARVAGLAEALPVSMKCSGLEAAAAAPAAAGAAAGPIETKLALRRAFAGRLPGPVVRRPKASFPMPFQVWMGGMTAYLDAGPGAEVFTPEAIALVRADPASSWRFAWPMLNLALWLDRWWGNGAASVPTRAESEMPDRAGFRVAPLESVGAR